MAVGLFWREAIQVVSDITSNRELVEIYAKNMQYACGEDYTYRVFRVEDNKGSGKKLKDQNTLSRKKWDREIDDRIMEQDFVVKEGTLPGREFYIKFEDPVVRALFEQDSEWPTCQLYWFKGYPKTNYIPDMEDSITDHFIASEYKIIRDRECEIERQRETEKMLQEIAAEQAAAE